MELNSVEFSGQEKEGNSNSNSQAKLNPLEMENILEKILTNLDLKSLRAARLVSRLWNSEGIKILFKNYFIRLPPALYSRENRKKKGNKKLRELFKTFLSRNSFKIPHLSIHEKSDAAVLKVIEGQGQGQGRVQEVRSLRWPECSYREKGPEKLLKALLYQLPNLNYLENNKKYSLTPEKVIMDFCLATKTKTKSHPNQNSPLVLSRFYMSCSPVRLLSSIEDLEKFSKCEGVLIQIFVVDFFFVLASHPHLQNRIISTITAFLWRNQANLRGLRVANCQQNISQVLFPVMPRLSKLFLSFDERPQDSAINIVYELSESFKFSEVTPKLKEVHLPWLGDLNADETEEADSDTWTRVFESAGSAPSVQIFRYRDLSIAGHNVDKLLQMFPNLQDFDVSDIPNPGSALMSVWKFGKSLVRLSLKFDLDALALEIFNLDRIFTGFSQDTVDKINSRDGEFQSASSVDVGFDVESLRVNPSILDLKGLKSVKMSINFRSDFIEDEYEYNFPGEILSVAGEYAFKLMPKVDFHFKLKCRAPHLVCAAAQKLSQLPNVTFVAREDYE